MGLMEKSGKIKLAWAVLKDNLVKWLKSKAVTLVLKKILGSVAMGGVRGWLIKYALGYVFDHMAEPIIRKILREAGYIYHLRESEVYLKRMTKAKKEGDSDAYDDAVDDLYS